VGILWVVTLRFFCGGEGRLFDILIKGGVCRISAEVSSLGITFVILGITSIDIAFIFLLL
jgi:hypothetical protein